MRKLLLVFTTPLLFQCGGNECDCPVDAGGDTSADGAQKDAATNDAAADVAATNDASDGGLACTSPAACQGGAASICCGTVVLNGGTSPSCIATSVTSACAAQCTTTFVQNCSGTETVRLCAQTSDCASDPTNDECCTFTSGNQSLTFCASQAVANGAGATCK